MQSTTFYNQQSRRDDRAITMRIREIEETRIRYGCSRIHIQLRREGWLVNYKKTHRIYCPDGLNLRRKRPRRHVTAMHHQHRPVLDHVDHCWSMNFVSDNLFNRHRVRALTVVDNFSRECLALYVGKSLMGEDVVDVMEALRVLSNRLPKRIIDFAIMFFCSRDYAENAVPEACFAIKPRAENLSGYAASNIANQT